MSMLQIVNLVGLWLVVGLCLLLTLTLAHKLENRGLLDVVKKPKPGQMISDFDLRTLDNTRVTTRDFLGQEHLLFFITPGCKICAEQLPEIKKLVPIAHDKAINVVIVGDGLLKDVAEYTQNLQLDALIYATDNEDEAVMEALAFEGFPYFFWLDANNRVLASGFLLDDAIWETVQLLMHRPQ
jgi:peroxiredoxin